MKISQKDLDMEFEKLSIKIGLNIWNHYSSEGPSNIEESQNKMRDLLLANLSREIISEHGGNESKQKILHRVLLTAKVDFDSEVLSMQTELDNNITNYIFRLRGNNIARVKLNDILANSSNRNERKEAYLAFHELHNFNENKLKLLIQRRNKFAKEVGFRNYFEYSLFQQEIDETWLINNLTLIKKEIQKSYQKVLSLIAEQLQITLEDLAPYDIRYGFNRIMPEIDSLFRKDEAIKTLRKFITRIGFNFENLPIKIKEKDIPYGGYSVAISIPNDMRLLINPYESEKFYYLLFHEFGHCLHGSHIMTTDPFMKGYEWVKGAHNSLYAEIMADMLAEFLKNRGWLETFLNLSEKEINKVIANQAIEDMYRIMGFLFKQELEKSLYETDCKRIDEIYTSLYQELFLVQIPQKYLINWADDTWYTSYPIYYYTYILAPLFSSDIHRRFRSINGEKYYSDPKLSNTLCDYFYSTGEESHWLKRIETFLGRKIDLNYRLKEINGIISYL